MPEESSPLGQQPTPPVTLATAAVMETQRLAVDREEEVHAWRRDGEEPQEEPRGDWDLMDLGRPSQMETGM